MSSLAEAIEFETAEPVIARAPSLWVRVSTEAPAVRGFGCIVRVDATGEHYIGRLLSYPFDPQVEVELLGRPEPAFFDRDSVTVSILPAHSWRERQAVVERQRRGEPATVRPVRAKRRRRLD
jgi:hypothetical protein